MIEMAFLWERICEFELKTSPLRSSLESFPFVKQLTQVAGLIEDHLDLSTGLKKHLPSQVSA